MSNMNMPPLPYLARLPGLSTETFAHCHADPSVWAKFDPALMALANPDPQAFRPSPNVPNVLQVKTVCHLRPFRDFAGPIRDLVGMRAAER
jgi:hypothetical protein